MEYDFQVGDSFINSNDRIAVIEEIKFPHLLIRHPSGIYEHEIEQVIKFFNLNHYTNYKSIKNEKTRIIATEQSGKRNIQITNSNQKRRIATSSGYSGNRVSFRTNKIRLVKSQIKGEICSC